MPPKKKSKGKLGDDPTTSSSKENKEPLSSRNSNDITEMSKMKPKEISKMKPVWVMKKKAIPDIPRNPIKDRMSRMLQNSEGLSPRYSPTSSSQSFKWTGRTTGSQASSTPMIGTTSFIRKKEKVEDWKTLQMDAMGLRQMSVWNTRAEQRNSASQCLYLKDQHKHIMLQKYRNSLKCEQHALLNWEQTQDIVERLEEKQTKQSGRSKGKIISRKDLHLLKTGFDGEEKDIWTEERIETPDQLPATAFFKLPEPTRTGLTPFITKRELGYNIAKDFAGVPFINKNIEIPKKKKGVGNSCRSNSQNDNEKITINEMYVPMIKSLTIVGHSYVKTQTELRLAGYGASKRAMITTPANKHPDHNIKSYRRGTTGMGNIKQQIIMIEPYISKVCLKFGEHILKYGGKSIYSSCDLIKENEFIVQCGSSSVLGQNSYNHVHMMNLGTTAIHFSWSKVSPSKYVYDRFIFDHWGGTILPNETLKIPVLYKGNQMGYCSEDWKLLTQPVLENGKSVIFRLWGFSKVYDQFSLSRDKVDQKLNENIPQTLVSLQVRKIIDNLPLPDTEYKDIRFRLVTAGPDLFLYHNPDLIYKSVPVYRLTKLYEILRNRKKLFNRHSSSAPRNQSIYSFRESIWLDSDMSVGLRISPYYSDDHSETSQTSQEKESDLLDATTHTPSGQDIVAPPPHDFDEDWRHNPVQYYSNLIEPEPRRHNSKSASQKKSVTDEQETVKAASKISSSESVMSHESLHQLEVSDSFTKQASPSMSTVIAPVLDLNFNVKHLRDQILKYQGDPEEQEAFFTLMAEDTTKLNFRPSLSEPNWRHIVFYSALAEAMDKFNTYAHGLREMYDTAAELVSDRSGSKVKSIMNRESVNVSEVSTERLNTDILDVVTSANRQMGNDWRHEEEEGDDYNDAKMHRDMNLFRQQYNDHTHLYMYQLLSDLMDEIDVLFDSEKVFSVPHISYDEAPFRQVQKKQIEMAIDTAYTLDAPLPMPWVGLAEKMASMSVDSQLKRRNCTGTNIQEEPVTKKTIITTAPTSALSI